MQTRVYFLDNLRTFMIFLVVVLHAGIVYEPILQYTWIVSDPVKAGSIGLVRMYLDLIVMFTLFFVSGYFVPMSLKKYNSWGFIRSKFRRIMLPWLIAVLTLIPLYKVIFLASRGLPQQEWFSYFHVFFREGGHAGYFADNPTQSWLWFLPVLFMFQLVYLVLAKSNLLRWRVSLKTAVVLVFAIGLVYSMMISTLDMTGWYHSALLHFQKDRLLVYFMVFLLGSLCYRLRVFDTGRMSKKWYIVSNVVLSLSLAIFTAVALNLFFNMIEPGREHYFVSKTADRIAYYATMLTSMLSFLHIFIYSFRSYVNKSNRFMGHLSRNSYGVYIIHMVVLGAIAWPMLQLSLPVVVKYLTLAALTFIVSNALVSLYYRIIKLASGTPGIQKVSTCS